LEFNSEGAVDLYSSNSVNVRTQGTLNFHADKDINFYAGGTITTKADTIRMQGQQSVDILSENSIKIYSDAAIAVRSDGTLNLRSASGSWGSEAELVFKAEKIDLNGAAAAAVNKPQLIKDRKLPDTKFETNKGWVSTDAALTTIVTRAPTHEPYQFHNRGTRTGA
jgi:hypothetical protein